MKRESYQNSTKKIYFVITLIIIATLLYAIFFSIKTGNYITLFTSIATLILTFLPWILHKTYKIKLPTEIELIIVLFIYATLFLGEVQNFYNTFWWWDIFLHTGSAIVFGFIGFTLVYFIADRHEIKTRTWALAVFSFSFAIAIGAVWEIFEFFMDQTFGWNMQKSGLMDTMTDLIVDTLGALISSGIALIYLKTKKTVIFNDIIQKFRKEK